MSNIRVDLSYAIADGSEVVFNAPCNCNEITGLKVYHSGGSKVFTFKDAHGNNLTGIGNLFSKGALVKAILDVTNGYAFLQNADTNAYLEERFDSKAPAGYGLGETVKWIYAPETLADYIHSGFYSWANGVSDAPFPAGSMIVVKRSDTYVYQLAFQDDVAAPTCALRKLTNTTWSEWVDCSPSAFAPAGFGLGVISSKSITSQAALDSAKTTGWYWYSVAGTSINGQAFNHAKVCVQAEGELHGVQMLYPVGSASPLIRRLYDGTYGEWECDNPPMNTNTEYRTTERINGAAVYKRRNSSGIIEYRLDGETTWKNYSGIVGARPASWLPTIAEIGAAPAGYGLGTTGKRVSTSDDLNDVYLCGFYSWDYAPANAPFANGVMLVLSYSSDRLVQVIWNTPGSHTPKYRIQYGGTWSSWKEVGGTLCEFDTGATNIADGVTWEYNGSASKFYIVTMQIGTTAYRHTFVVDWVAVNAASGKQIGYYSDAYGSKLNLVASIDGNKIKFRPGGGSIVHIRGYY